MGAEMPRRLQAACLMLAGLGSACVGAEAPAPAAGFVVITASGKAHLHLSQVLRPGQTLWTQWPGRKGQPLCCKKFAASDWAMAPQPAGEESAYEVMASGGSPTVRYALKTPPARRPLAQTFVGIAVAAPRVQARSAVELRAGTALQARLCLGAEGVNLLTRAGSRRSVLYLGLGYSLARSRHQCTRQDEAFIEQAGS